MFDKDRAEVQQRVQCMPGRGTRFLSPHAGAASKKPMAPRLGTVSGMSSNVRPPGDVTPHALVADDIARSTGSKHAAISASDDTLPSVRNSICSEDAGCEANRWS